MVEVPVRVRLPRTPHPLQLQLAVLAPQQCGKAKLSLAGLRDSYTPERFKQFVSCGGHDADSCSVCPQGPGSVWHGAGWCSGECKWEDDRCVDK